jgi:hypothetical protein
MANQGTWADYEEKIAHWRPQFGNDNHIHARDVIEDINRMTPRYIDALVDYRERSQGKD